ncbi:MULTISPECIES: ABC transporter substrate-binding protein [environmental samples]|uniref:ABC transporter substrate-binding protein n=1 Tax=environmental samples TaxID=876090 RepID=UPI00033B5694|nr:MULTISPECIES: ABC transporter substrate-binding protein [environmental samples]CDC74156.1 receptor family ligand binding domain protein [Oscillibacter sp. CAG:155]
MKKKLLSLVMAAAMVLGLAACGSNSDTADTSGSDDSASGTTFKIGTIGPLTGENAIYGLAVANGAKIAVEEINASDSAIKFELQSQDDVADGETSVNAYNKLMDWGMQLLVGPTTTGAAQAVSAVTNTDRTFMLTPSASSTDVIDGKDNVFQVCFTDPNQGSSSADYMAENMPDAKIAIIYRNDDAYSQGIHDTFVTEAAAKGLNVVYEGTFTKDTATDFSVQLTGAQSAGADLVFLPIYYQPASVILNQANAMGYAPTFFGVDGMDGILTMEGFDTSLAEGVMLLTPFSATLEENQSFVQAYQDEFGDTPNQFAADAYDAVYILKAALEAAECTPDMSSADICEALIPVMPTLSYDGLTGKGMTWDASGAVSKDPTAFVIENGTYVLP